jgi:hypothetical protein
LPAAELKWTVDKIILPDRSCLRKQQGFDTGASIAKAFLFKKGEDLDIPGHPPKVSVFAKRILSYWIENPHGKDTLDGIADWWVRYQEFRYWRPRVKDALSELVDKKLVLEKQGRDSQIYYELNRKLEAEIRRIVGSSRRK